MKSKKAPEVKPIGHDTALSVVLFQKFQLVSKETSVLLSREGIILSASQAFAACIGLSANELIGKNYCSLFPSPLREKKQGEIELSLQKNSVRIFQDQIGSAVCISTITPFYNENKQILGAGIIFTLQDETRDRTSPLDILKQLLPLKKEQLLQNVVQALSAQAGISMAFIGKLKYNGKTALSTIAAAQGGSLIPDFEFILSGTPSAKAIVNSHYYCHEGLVKLYPHDPLINDLNAGTYYGILIELSDGTPWGVIALFGNSSGVQPELYDVLFPAITKIISAEIEIMQHPSENKEEQNTAPNAVMNETQVRDIFTCMQAGYALFEVVENEDASKTDFKYLDTNTDYEQIIGFDRSQLFGKTIRDMHPEVEEKLLEIERGVLRTGAPAYLTFVSHRTNKEYVTWIYSPGQDRIAVLFFDSSTPNADRFDIYGNNFSAFEIPQSGIIGSYKVDIAGNTWQSSKIFNEIFGISESYPHDLESWLNLLHLNEKEIPITRQQDEPVKNRVPFDKEYYIIRQTDGQVRYVSDNGVQIYNENGDISLIIGSVIDISEHKSSEKALYERERRLKSFMDHIPAVISIKDNSGKILFTNDRFIELYGIESPLGKTMYDFVGNEVADQMALDDMKVLKKQRIQKVERIISKNSELLFFDTTIFAIPVSTTEILIGRMSVDISAKIRTESKLLETGRKLSSLMNNLPGVVYRCKYSRRREIEFVSQGCLELTGYTAQDFTENDKLAYQDLIRPDDRERVVEAIYDAVSARKPYTITYQIIDKAGDKKWVWEKGAGIFDESGILLYLEGFLNDITTQKLVEIALQESQERYREFVENDISGDYITTPGGKILYCNKTFITIFGFSDFDEARSYNVINLYANKRDRLTFLDDLKRDGKVERHEVLMKNRNGDVLHILENATGEFDPHGMLVRLHGYLIDITDFKRDEEEIQVNQARLNTLHSLNKQKFNSEQEIVSYVLAEVVKSLQSQFGFLHFLNAAGTEFQPLYWYNISGFENPLIIENSKKLSECGIWAVEAPPHAPKVFNSMDELTDVRGLPPKSPHLDRLALVSIYEDDRLIALCGIANKTQDYNQADLRQFELFMNESWQIIKRRRIEAELHKLSMVVEQSPVSVVMTDLNGTITYVNKKFLMITGYAAGDIIGQNSRILKTGYTTAEEYRQLWTVIRSGGVWTGELYNKKRNGDFFWESVLISPLKNVEGTIIGYAAVKEDITQRKQMMYDLVREKERAEEMNTIKDAFFANMSHELRTPMIGIMGFSEVLLDSTKDPEIRSMLETIYNSAARLTQTLNLILEVSKLESQAMEVNYSYIDAIQVIDRIKLQVERDARKKKLALEINAPYPECKIETDEGMFTQILLHLVSNAIKYTNAGKVSVSLETDGNSLTIKVSDTGIGIPKDKQSLIWQEFRQVSEGLSRKYDGIGLGLTVVKRFVELLKGTIEIESQVNFGTTFTVSLPVWKDKSTPALVRASVKTVSPDKNQPHSYSGLPKVLHIEDDPNMVSLVARYLDGVCDVDSTDSGVEGLERIKSTQYDIILMDINLGPGPDGMEVTQIIRQLRNYSDIPIIAVTAFAMTGDREAFLAIGCSHYLAKPFRRNTLVSLIAEVLRTRVK